MILGIVCNNKWHTSSCSCINAKCAACLCVAVTLLHAFFVSSCACSHSFIYRWYANDTALQPLHFLYFILWFLPSRSAAVSIVTCCKYINMFAMWTTYTYMLNVLHWCMCLWLNYKNVETECWAECWHA